VTTDLTGANWWREGVIYHIYPRSFADADGDGVGDLLGILEHLDHLNDGSDRSLGIDAIWLSPIYPSPMADFGYDVADYCDIDPVFGDLATFDRLVRACHGRGVRVVLDLVLNHTSDRHPWFRESRASRASARRAWYHWRDPAPGGGPPNGWTSVFGGSAWTLDAATGQYYLHSFLPEQPDLNWAHPEVVAAIGEVLRFWVRRGVDGFRVDAVQQLAKPVESDPGASSAALIGEGRIDPRIMDHLRIVRRVLDEFHGRIAIAEAYVPPEEAATLYGTPALEGAAAGVHLAFLFAFIRLVADGPYTPWEAPAIADLLERVEQSLPAGALPCYALSNHDVPRLRSRHDADDLGLERARAAALLLLGVRGVPCLYYGEEIGMPDVPIPPAHQRDPVGRDSSRTPMQWDRAPGRGFTNAVPWLPFGPLDVDVASQRGDDRSLLSLYRRAIFIRKREPALRRGEMTIERRGEAVLALRRSAQDARPVLVVVNTARAPSRVPLGREFEHILLASHESAALDGPPGSRELVLPALAAAWLVP